MREGDPNEGPAQSLMSTSWLWGASMMRASEAGTKKRSDNLPGTLDACIRMLHASISVLTHLGTLNRLGVPPSPLGAMWSWPQAWRSFRAVVEAANEVAAEVLIVRTLGSTELADSAYDAAKMISELMQSSTATRKRPRDFVPQDKLEQTVDALVQFRTMVRDTFEEEHERPHLDI